MRGTAFVCCVSAVAALGICHAGLAAEAKAKKEGPEPYALPRDIDLGPGKLDLGVRLRLRYEWFNNYNLKTYGTNKSDEVLGEKLWLDAAYRVGDNFLAFLRIQDDHFWLSDFDADDFTAAAPHACSYEDPFDLAEAYVNVRKIGGTPLGVKAGRQFIVYGDQRIWGPGDWNNSGKFIWDGAKVMWRSRAADVDGIYAKRVVSNPDEFNSDHYDFDAWGVYGTVKQLPFDLDVFYVLKTDSHKTTAGEAGTNSLALNAAGLRVSWKPMSGAEMGGTVVREFGEWGDDRLDAWGVVVSAGYTVPLDWKPGVRLSYTYASGDSDPKDGVMETFDTIFGAAHRDYGLMDVVSWKNLHDYQVDLTAKPGFVDRVALSYHFLQLAEGKDAWYYATEKTVRRDKTGQSGTDLGQELDLLLSKKVNGNLSVEVALCHFFAGDFAEATGKGKDADWAYVMTTMTF